MNFGVISGKPSTRLMDLLICCADKALYMTKEKGKNRSVSANLEEGKI